MANRRADPLDYGDAEQRQSASPASISSSSSLASSTRPLEVRQRTRSQSEAAMTRAALAARVLQLQRHEELQQRGPAHHPTQYSRTAQRDQLRTPAGLVAPAFDYEAHDSESHCDDELSWDSRTARAEQLTTSASDTRLYRLANRQLHVSDDTTPQAAWSDATSSRGAGSIQSSEDVKLRGNIAVTTPAPERTGRLDGRNYSRSSSVSPVSIMSPQELELAALRRQVEQLQYLLEKRAKQGQGDQGQKQRKQSCDESRTTTPMQTSSGMPSPVGHSEHRRLQSSTAPTSRQVSPHLSRASSRDELRFTANTQPLRLRSKGSVSPPSALSSTTSSRSSSSRPGGRDTFQPTLKSCTSSLGMVAHKARSDRSTPASPGTMTPTSATGSTRSKRRIVFADQLERAEHSENNVQLRSSSLDLTRRVGIGDEEAHLTSKCKALPPLPHDAQSNVYGPIAPLGTREAATSTSTLGLSSIKKGSTSERSTPTPTQHHLHGHEHGTGSGGLHSRNRRGGAPFLSSALRRRVSSSSSTEKEGEGGWRCTGRKSQAGSEADTPASAGRCGRRVAFKDEIGGELEGEMLNERVQKMKHGPGRGTLVVRKK